MTQTFRHAAASALDDAQLRSNLRTATHAIRDKRLAAIGEVADWEQLREAGRRIKARTMRHLDTHLEAIKVPYAHSNVQADEVLYYVRGRFGSRRGVEEASFTLHPRGIPHGPHPGTIVASRPMTRSMIEQAAS